MYWRSTSYGSVSVPVYIVSISVFISINSMCGASVSSASTPLISRSHIGLFLKSRKSLSLGCPWPIAFTREIRLLGIGLASQIRLTAFSVYPRVTNSNPPCLFPLVIIKIAPLVWGLVIFRGVSSSCIFQYWRVSPVMIDLGLIFFKIPAVVGGYPKRFTLFNTKFIVKSTGNLIKGRLCLVDLHLSFTTQILR